MTSSDFLIYCHEDAKCTLKTVDNEEIRKFDDVSEAMRAIVELKKARTKVMVTVYSTMGSVIFQTVV